MFKRNKTLKLTVLVLVTIFVSSVFAVPVIQVSPANWDYPQYSEKYFHIYTTTESRLAAFRAGTIADAGCPTTEEVIEFTDGGWNITHADDFGYYWWAMNCRDYAGTTWNSTLGKEEVTRPDVGWTTPGPRGYPSPGESMYPMNVTKFRQAIAYLLDKTSLIATVYGVTMTRVDNFVTPAMDGVYPGGWANPAVPTYEYNPTKAMDLLEEIGFSNDTGRWCYPSDEQCPVPEWRGQPMADVRPIIIISTAPDVTTTADFVDAAVADFDEFFGETGVVLHDGRGSETPWIVYQYLIYCSYDIGAGIGWILGRYIDYMYGVFHSKFDTYLGYNFPGIHDPTLDAALTTIHTSLVWAAVMAAGYVAQSILCTELPYIPIGSSTNYAALGEGPTTAGAIVRYKEDWLEASGYDYGTNSFNYDLEHWVSAPIDDPSHDGTGVCETFHAGYADWTYEYHILDRVLGFTINVEPYSKADIPWVVADWKSEVLTESECADLGIEQGMKHTYVLRNDVYWHDGRPFTAEDMIYNLDLLARFQPGRYSETWMTYVKGVAYGDHVAVVYANEVSLYGIYNYPINFWQKELCEQVIDDGGTNPWNATDFEQWQMWNMPHPDFLEPGVNPWEATMADADDPAYWPDWWNGDFALTQLIGIGPWIFKESDVPETATYATVVRWDDALTDGFQHWLRLPVYGSLSGDTRVTSDNVTEVTGTYLDVYFMNVHWSDDHWITDPDDSGDAMTVDWNITMDGTELIDEGTLTMTDMNWTSFRVDITDWLGTGTGPHTFTLWWTVYSEPETEFMGIETKVLFGDANNDEWVDMTDIGLACLAYGSWGTAAGEIPHPRWNEYCDVNGDNFVDMTDIGIMCLMFGENLE